MWNGRWILKYKGWYFAITMQKILLCWEIWNIIIRSNNGNIKTLVSWSSKRTAPIVCCWYGRTNSVCWGSLYGGLKNWQEKMTKIEIWEWWNEIVVKSQLVKSSWEDHNYNAIRNLSKLFNIQRLTVFLLVLFIHWQINPQNITKGLA